MYGPNITKGGLFAFLAIVLSIGGLLGIGCYEGCGYVIDHVTVDVK